MDNIQYRVVGMDCAKDARAVEAAATSTPGVVSAKVSNATHILVVTLSDPENHFALVEAVSRVGFDLQPVEGPGGSTGSLVTPGYRRALWIVVALNIGFGIAEGIGGFLAESQALKADSLDFLGDGLITLFAVAAMGWSLRWRARSALVQGLFLGALGLGVLVNTVYRIIFQQLPEAELMGWIAVAALVANVAAAAVLIPHRAGDANARAVWLFSRNDALGNASVVVAALLVAWTDTAWPDLIVAGIVALLFLHSAWAIVRDARSDLRTAAEDSNGGNLQSRA